MSSDVDELPDNFYDNANSHIMYEEDAENCSVTSSKNESYLACANEASTQEDYFKVSTGCSVGCYDTPMLLFGNLKNNNSAVEDRMTHNHENGENIPSSPRDWNESNCRCFSFMEITQESTAGELDDFTKKDNASAIAVENLYCKSVNYGTNDSSIYANASNSASYVRDDQDEEEEEEEDDNNAKENNCNKAIAIKAEKLEKNVSEFIDESIEPCKYKRSRDSEDNNSPPPPPQQQQSIQSVEQHQQQQEEEYKEEIQPPKLKRNRIHKDIITDFPEGEEEIKKAKDTITTINQEDLDKIRFLEEYEVNCYYCGKKDSILRVFRMKDNNCFICKKCAKDKSIQKENLEDFYEHLEYIRGLESFNFKNEKLYKCDRLNHAKPFYCFLKFNKNEKCYIVTVNCVFCRNYKCHEYALKQRK